MKPGKTCLASLHVRFVIPAKPPKLGEPCNASLNNPPLGDSHKTSLFATGYHFEFRLEYFLASRLVALHPKAATRTAESAPSYT